MKEKKKSTIQQLLDYSGSYKWFTIVGCILSAISMLLSMLPYIYIWLLIKDLVNVAPNWSMASNIRSYAVMAFVFALLGILLYFIGLMFTHLAAFRTAENIRKQGLAKMLKAPIGFFDNNASGLLRNKIDAAASETETLLAHNLADIVGTITLFISMLVLLLVFDWRMGLACLMCAVISIMALFSMMGGKNVNLMKEYQEAQDRMSKAGTEYVRGIPVVKIFQQTVNSFKTFKNAIEEYSDKAQHYQGDVCKVPQAINLTFTEGAFVFLVPAAIMMAPSALSNGNFKNFVVNFAFYAIFSAIISTALAKIMFAASGMMLAETALNRIDVVMNAPELEVCDNPQVPKDNGIEFKNVSFKYDVNNQNALNNVSFSVKPGETIALVGPSGGGKTTIGNLIPRFFDVNEGSIEIGGIDVRKIDPKVLMNNVAFVFQNNRLFKSSIYENVRMAKPDANKKEVEKALSLAQCDDIINKLPDGMDTIIGSKGTFLSGGEIQRVAIARAILKNAPIVILDEATAFADPENEAQIQKAIRELTKDKTVVMIAHRLSTVVDVDKIIVLDNGNLVEQGSHKQLLKNNNLYADMWKEYNQAVNWKISTERKAA